MKRVAMIGFGAIGVSIARDWKERPPAGHLLVGVCMRPHQVDAAVDLLPPETTICTDIEAVLALEPDCVIEAAGHGVIRSFGVRVLRQGCDLYVLSVGALASAVLREDLMSAATSRGGNILIPAGALAAFDGLRTLAGDGLVSVKYTSTKPCESWRGTPAAEIFPLADLTTPTVIFRGNAREAAGLYPMNANLAAAVALAGIGFERTLIELVADPHSTRNSGRLEAVSASSLLTLEVSSLQSTNPKTSVIVGASVRAALENAVAVIRFV
jgi:aspartate dehydrogenase